MTIKNLNTIEMLKAFLDGNQSVAFSVLGNKTERYQFIQTTLVKFNYITLPRKNKSIVIQYLMKMTEYSRQQLTRLIKKYTYTGKIKWMPCRRNGFAKTYTDKDIILLAKTDELHDTPCGHAVKKLCERAHHVFDEKAYQRLSKISVSHLYNLRDSDRYKRQRRHFTKTKPRQVAIGQKKSLILKVSQVTFVLIPYIKATRIRLKAYTTSMPLMKLPSLKLYVQSKKSVNNT